MLKFDLHIHSFASKYKESTNIVDNSTIANIDVLFKKLEEYEVGLFAITDHNRFNVDLYQKLEELINDPDHCEKYPHVKSFLAGVEFDVRINPEMGKCHIITIFDARHDMTNYRRIADAISENELTSPEQAYERAEFENLLRRIGLDTILIACQRSDMNRQPNNPQNSLSESTESPTELISVGFINALEYHKPNVEGILQNNLKQLPQQVLLISGSDCHEWEHYPKHDKTNYTHGFQHSKAKILPTFKGLLMAVTSPETRINRSENSNNQFFPEICINGERKPLVNGINAIIGENGSGKSTLLKLLYGATSEQHVKRIIAENAMTSTLIDTQRVEYIAQGEIVRKFEDNSLFDGQDNFLPINDQPFCNAYRKYATELMKAFRSRIKVNDEQKSLATEVIEYKEIDTSNQYFVSVTSELGFSEVQNKHVEPLTKVNEVKGLLNSIINDQYFEEYKDDLSKVIDIILKLYASINRRRINSEAEISARNIIASAFTDYQSKIDSLSTSLDVEKREYERKKQQIVNDVTTAIVDEAKLLAFPCEPAIFEGKTENPKNGFSFNRVASYHETNMHQAFLKKMFTMQYWDIHKLVEITTIEQLQEAVRNCTASAQIDEWYEKNLSSFLEEACKCSSYIVDSASEVGLGNTLGEMSLAYFKYLTSTNSGKPIILIDQPEDHISNNNICKKLFSYLNSIRYSRQIIFVTHNPLLVVNLDVDNVLFVKKAGMHIDIASGCLELETDEINMLDTVANNMDGGKTSVEKRLRVYGKEN